MKMITKESVLRPHAKSGWFVEPNAEDVHFIGASAIVFVLPNPNKPARFNQEIGKDQVVSN